jgi:signal recognition particle receptor subunit beta
MYQGEVMEEVRVVDVPGHSRLFSSSFSQHVDRARGIVFLVDSVDFMSQKEQVAQQLYQVLAHPVVCRRRVPVLLACNKADCGAKAHTPDFIRKRLEKGIDQLRSTQRTLSTDKSKNDPFERVPEPFTFFTLARAHGTKLTVCELSALLGDVKPAQDFILDVSLH